MASAAGLPQSSPPKGRNGTRRSYRRWPGCRIRRRRPCRTSGGDENLRVAVLETRSVWRRSQSTGPSGGTLATTLDRGAAAAHEKNCHGGEPGFSSVTLPVHFHRADGISAVGGTHRWSVAGDHIERPRLASTVGREDPTGAPGGPALHAVGILAGRLSGSVIMKVATESHGIESRAARLTREAAAA